jgi:hypothetical protein
LQSRDQLTAGKQGVITLVRHFRVTAAALDNDFEYRQRTNQAGPAKATVDRQAEPGEALSDKIGCALLVEGEFRMCMQILPP